MKRVILIVLDGLGIGALPDAGKYGDIGSNTLGHLAVSQSDLLLPNLEQLGLGRIASFQGIKALTSPKGAFGRMAERSAGKDTLVGHWEMMGAITEEAFPTYPNGFPLEIMRPFESKIGRGILGNCVAAGTEIIDALGEQHMAEGSAIVYTSVDSVFQIAAHEAVISPSELYEICEIARAILKPPHHVARVIARPFEGKPGSFCRTERRRDLALPPPSVTLLDHLHDASVPVIGIGKIEDIFSGHGISEAMHTRNNDHGMDETLYCLDKIDHGLIFTNLVDFDMLYGHRNDPLGYARALERFDAWLPEITSKMRAADWLFITADHGNDPLFPGTDHTREYVPLLAYNKEIGAGIDLGTRESFSDLGQTVAEIFKVKPIAAGESFLHLMVS